MPLPPLPCLVADIGGTNTRVARCEAGQILTGTARRFRNAEFASLEDVLQRFLAESEGATPNAACLAMAGPVSDGTGRMTNLDWTISCAGVSKAIGTETVVLLNDLQAQGHALGHLPESSLEVILAATSPAPGHPQLVVGLGTGFNAAPVYDLGSSRLVPASEAGHASLPARTQTDLDLVRFITERHGFCSIEDGLSGRGLVWIHEYLCHRDSVPGGRTSADILAICADAGHPDRARAIEAVQIYVRLAGEVCGDLALTLLPFGGIYLIGGMARALAPHMREMGFGTAFRDKGRFAGFMEQFAVHLVEDDDAALIGCARHLHSIIGG